MFTRALPMATALMMTLIASASPAVAQGYWYYDHDCANRIHNNGVAGALLGGAAGAVLGSNLASHGRRTGGTLLGGAAGAAIGSNIARSATKESCRDYRYSHRRYRHYGSYPAYGYAPQYRGYYAVPDYYPDYGYVSPYVYYGPGWYGHHHHDEDEDDDD